MAAIRIVVLEEAFEIDLVDPETGEDLELRLRGYIDLVEADGTVVDLKTAARLPGISSGTCSFRSTPSCSSFGEVRFRAFGSTCYSRRSSPASNGMRRPGRSPISPGLPSSVARLHVRFRRSAFLRTRHGAVVSANSSPIARRGGESSPIVRFTSVLSTSGS
jgi:hypothetical protein